MERWVTIKYHGYIKGSNKSSLIFYKKLKNI